MKNNENTHLALGPGFYESVSERDYHADNLCEMPTLSCSLAKVLNSKSALHAWHEHPRLGKKKRKPPTSDMEYGSAAHKLLLGKGADLQVIDAKDYKTDAAKDARDAAREAGRIPILSAKRLELTAQHIAFEMEMRRLRLWDIYSLATPEVVTIYDDGPVRCRAMLDRLYIDEATKRFTIFDLKNTDSANPEALGRQIFNMSYDMQKSSYVRAVEILRPDLAGRGDFIFLFQETEDPFCLTPARVNGESSLLGASKWSRAWQTWHECLRADNWPAYGDSVVDIAPPDWALSAEMGA